jgi:hypothetical protein
MSGAALYHHSKTTMASSSTNITPIKFNSKTIIAGLSIFFKCTGN